MDQHPIDRLGQLRTQIDAMQAEYQAIRQLILEGVFGTEGNEYSVELVKKTRRTITLRTAEEKLTREQFESIVTSTTQTNVIVRPK